MSPPTSTDPTAIQQIDLSLIHEGPADKQRIDRHPDRIAELAASMQQIGVITPLILRATDKGYETIAGGYRREAARLANLTHVPAQVIECSDATAWSISTAENLQRHNLSPVEEANIVRIAHIEQGLTLEQVAHSHGRTTAWVNDRLDLLTWDPLILHAIHTGQLKKAAAAPLATIENSALRKGLLDDAIRYGATARTTSTWVQTARLRSDLGDPSDTTAIINSPDHPPQRVVGDCWMCSESLEMKHLTHLPTCPLCVEQVSRAHAHAAQPIHADSPATAASHSSAVTPA